MKGMVATAGASTLYRQLTAAHPGVEVWPDEGLFGEGWSDDWIVSRCGGGTIRNLAYVRLRGDQPQHRTYGDARDDLWLPAE